MQNGEPNIYSGLATLRNGESTLRWQRAGMFLAFNVVAWPIEFDPTFSGEFHFVLSIVGFVLSMAWITLNARAQSMMQFWDTKLSELELLDTGTNEARVKVFSDPKLHAGIFTFHHVLLILSLGSFGSWFAQLIHLSPLSYEEIVQTIKQLFN